MLIRLIIIIIDVSYKTKLIHHCDANDPHGFPVSILYKSIAVRYRPVRVADGPLTVRYRFIKNASWVDASLNLNSSSSLNLLMRFYVTRSKIVTDWDKKKSRIWIIKANRVIVYSNSLPLSRQT